MFFLLSHVQKIGLNYLHLFFHYIYMLPTKLKYSNVHAIKIETCTLLMF